MNMKEKVNKTHQKSNGEHTSVDFEKVYDSLEWDFSSKALELW